MSTYKNIPLFADFDSQDFLVWRELFLSYQDTHHPETAQMLRHEIFDGHIMYGTHGEGEMASPHDEGHGDDDIDGASDDAAVAAVVGESNARRSLNVATQQKDVSFYFLGQRSEVSCYICKAESKSGLICTSMDGEYAQWQDARGPALQREYDAFKSLEAEAVAAMCKRFDTLCLQLSRVGMAPTPRAAIQHQAAQV
jgi:hypothetical protein